MSLVIFFTGIPLFTIHATSIDERVVQLRHGMLNREPNITITYENATEDIAKEIFIKAIENTDSPVEGDYLAYHTYWAWYYPDISINQDKITYSVNYTDSVEQENEISNAVKKILSELNIEHKSDYEKVCAINDWIVNTIEFENVSVNNLGSAYTAFINKKTPCRGYALAFYRLCKEVNVPVRVVYREDKKHEWNLVMLNNKWYHVDTQGSNYKENKRLMFLLGSNNIPHKLSDDFADLDISIDDYNPDEINNNDENATHMVIKSTKFTNIENTSNGIQLTWKKVKNMYYVIYKKLNTGKYEKTITTKKTKWTDKDVKNGKKYTYKIYVMNGDGERSTGVTKTTIYAKSTKITYIKNSYPRKITIKWKQVNNTGYQIRYCRNKNFKNYKIKTIKNKKIISKKLTNLKKNKKYYIQIRTYKTVSGKKYYSNWSSTKNVKIKK